MTVPIGSRISCGSDSVTSSIDNWGLQVFSTSSKWGHPKHNKLYICMQLIKNKILTTLMLVPDHMSSCLEPPEYPAVSWEIIKMTFTWKRKMCNASSCKRKTGQCANLSEKESMRHRVLTCSLQCTTFHCLTKYLCETNFWQFEINITNTGIHVKKTEWPIEIYIVVLLESSPTHWPDRSAINK